MKKENKMKKTVLKDAYEELLNAVCKVKTKIVAQMFVVGEKYAESEKRLLVIGRALNGWGAFKDELSVDNLIDHWEKVDDGKIEYDRYSDKTHINKITEEERKGLEWVKSYLKESKEKTAKSSKFWELTRKVTHHVLGVDGENWTKYIAWTNLYKVAPIAGRNPSDSLCKKQLDSCIKILKEELELLKPTHVLVIAKKWDHKEYKKDSEDVWTKDFCQVIDAYRRNNEVKVVFVGRPEIRNGDAREKIKNVLIENEFLPS